MSTGHFPLLGGVATFGVTDLNVEFFDLEFQVVSSLMHTVEFLALMTDRILGLVEATQHSEAH